MDRKEIEPCLQPILNSPYIPLQGGLVNLWYAIEIYAQYNSDATLFTFGAVAMNIHFQTLVNLKGRPDHQLLHCIVSQMLAKQL